MKHIYKKFSHFLIIFIMGCSSMKETPFKINFEKYKLANGLTVILHKDTSDPLVAVATIVHVGSNREKPGKTGFAHFFEHMSFNDSENVPIGANRKLISELGGTRNGGTWDDGTMYYEVVPKDAFEKLLWIDSDRLGFMINTVTEDALEREKQVVKNEKRQRVDNQPYGHTEAIIRKALYPKGHPYSWTVIGELEDLQAATLDDVKEFYNKFYGPSNATLVIAGDIDINHTKELVERWFGEIKPSKENIADPVPQPVSLDNSKKLYYLDNFANLPEITISYPTVEQYHKDSYALSLLGGILTDGKNSPFYKQIVKTDKLAPSTYAMQRSSEIAGRFVIRIRANAAVSLDTVYKAIQKSLTNFENEGVNERDLLRIKTKQETQFYSGISSALDKAFQLGIYNEFAGDPGFITKDIESIKNVTKEDIQRVYGKYIKNKNNLITSVVPENEPGLILSGSTEAEIKEEKIVQGAEDVEFDANVVSEYEKTKTKYDRSEPPLGEPPLVSIPSVWKMNQSNGLKVYGIEHNELPLVQFQLRIDGGQMLDKSNKIGTAVLMASMLNEGTKSKTPAELEEAIGLLGARINISGNMENINISGNTLSRNFTSTMELITEMITEPRWDKESFELVKSRRLTNIKQSNTRAQSVAFRAARKHLYGSGHPNANPVGGTEETVKNISMQDLKDYFSNYVSPSVSHLHIVGDIDQQSLAPAIKTLNEKWSSKKVILPDYDQKVSGKPSKIYFIDMPDAKQSAIVIASKSVKASDPLHYKLEVANNRLGAGSSARLFQTLRIEKGYTYGAYSGITGNRFPSMFYAYGQVRSNVTLESLEIFKDLIQSYGSTFTDIDLEKTKNLLVKNNTRRFETLGNLIGMLDDISRFNLTDNYIENQQDVLLNMNMKEVRSLINQYMNEDNMTYIIVGDAKSQLDRVSKFGYGKPVVLDKLGNPI